MELLKQLLPAGEKHKWKQIAKQINRHNQISGNGDVSVNGSSNGVVDGNGNGNGNTSESTSNSTSGTGRSGTLSSLELEEDLSNGQSGSLNRKTVSATYVVRQYQQMLGFPKTLGAFGDLGSSLPYAVAEKGWDDIDEDEIRIFNED